MIGYITPESVASEVRLLRNDEQYQGAFLFVEGGKDATFFGNYVDSKSCLVRLVKGRPNVLKLISILESEGYTGILAIVDADYWHIEGISPPSSNVLITDTHDVETMIFASPAINKILKEYIPTKKLEIIENKYKSVQFAILKVVEKMAIIRWINYLNKLNISFYSDYERKKPIDWEKCIEIDKFFVDFDELINIICPQNSQIKKIIYTEVEKCKNLKYNLLQLCNGHDVVYVTYLVIKSKGRQREVDKMVLSHMDKAFRLSYESTYFRDTGLYKRILNWEKLTDNNILII
jgi:hypothetical protein